MATGYSLGTPLAHSGSRPKPVLGIDAGFDRGGQRHDEATIAAVATALRIIVASARARPGAPRQRHVIVGLGCHKSMAR